jgi:hypothetical protein
VLGKSARRFVLEHKSWPAMLASLPEIIGRRAQVGVRHAA